MSQQTQAQTIQWDAIILDLLILLLISGILTGISIFIQQSFTMTNPAQGLVSTIQKSKLIDGQDPVFEKSLADNLPKNAEFINTPDFMGRTPLMWACYSHYNSPKNALENDEKRLYYVNKLLSLPRIAIHAVDREGWTALHWAAWSGMPQTVETLLKAGASVDQAENNGFTPLMLAAMRGNVFTVSKLLEMKANIAATNKAGKTAFDFTVSDGMAYEKNNSWFFQKTYSSLRAVFFEATRHVLKGGAAPTLEELVQRAEIKEKGKRPPARTAKQPAA